MKKLYALKVVRNEEDEWSNICYSHDVDKLAKVSQNTDWTSGSYDVTNAKRCVRYGPSNNLEAASGRIIFYPTYAIEEVCIVY